MHDTRHCTSISAAVCVLRRSFGQRALPAALALVLTSSGCSLDLDALRAKPGSHSVNQTLGGIEGARDGGTAPGAWTLPEDAGTGWFPSSRPSKTSDAGSASCGVVGAACCMPGNTCSSGACLRGHCTTYAGLYAQASACSASPCSVRNPYSAGCSCPAGFDATPVWHGSTACANGDMSELELNACTADAEATTTWGGAWLEHEAGGSCKRACSVENLSTASCACPAGAGALRVSVEATDATCPGASEALALCIDPKAARVSFGGAYLTSPGATPAQSTCVVENPLTTDCTCPTNAMAETVPIADYELVACSM